MDGTADIRLRGRTSPIATRAHWPDRPGRLNRSGRPGLLVLLPMVGRPASSTGPAGPAGPAGDDAHDQLARRLAAHLGLVVLARLAPSVAGYAQALDDATTTVHWAADHAGELDADADRLVVAGAATGGRLAAAVALLARDHGWPPLLGQLLLRPALAGGGPGGPLNGVAPATVTTAGPGDDGARYAARLRAAGAEVDELGQPGCVDDQVLEALARSLGARGEVGT
jgi:acetyl esterase/lipase